MANKNYKLFYLPSYLQTADKNLSQVFAGSEPHFVPEITLTSQLERAQNRVTQFSQRYFSTQRWSLLMAFSSLLLSALKREAQPFYAIKRDMAIVVAFSEYHTLKESCTESIDVKVEDLCKSAAGAETGMTPGSFISMTQCHPCHHRLPRKYSHQHCATGRKYLSSKKIFKRVKVNIYLSSFSSHPCLRYRPIWSLVTSLLCVQAETHRDF